jgi:hypothetical protein
MKPKNLLLLVFLFLATQRLFAVAPVISSFSPASGPVGTLVTITGTGLNPATAFSVGGVPAIVVSNSGTKLVGMVMPGATKGVISVTTAAGTTASSGSFVVAGTSYPSSSAAPLVDNTVASPSYLGASVATTADGKIAIVGGPLYNSGQGAVWFFTRSGQGWYPYSSKLVGTDNIGASAQGTSVAVSPDGNTIIVGGPGDNGGVGAVWIFNNSKATKLIGTGTVGNAQFGSSVTLSADANTAVVAGAADNNSAGAIWTFTRSNGTWQQQGAKTEPASLPQSAGFASSIALSADGSTIICGGKKTAWVFVRNGTNWIQQGDPLSGGNDPVSGTLGTVALSADGNTALIASYGSSGGALVFTRQNGIWTKQKSIVSSYDARTVAVSADGNTAIIGSPRDYSSTGLIDFYTRIAGNWTGRNTGVISGSKQLGKSVAIAADGRTAIAGAPGDGKGRAGAFYERYNSNNGQTITFTLPDTIKYGDNDITLNGISDSGLPVRYDNTNIDVAAIVNGKLQIKAPGMTTITAMQEGNSTYFAALPVSQVVTVNKAPLTIKADDKTGISTHPLPELTYTITGFVKNETVANLSTTPVISTTANTASPAGNYPITVNGATSNNYEINQLPGTLTLNSSTLPGPAIASLSASSGVIGSLIKINGTALDFATSLTIGGKPAIIVSNTATQIVGMVMPGAGSGNVSVTTATGTVTSTGSFTVVAGQAPNSQQGFKLVGGGNTGPATQGDALAASADGNTLIIGGSYDNSGMGASWIFTRAGGSWSQQGDKLFGTGASGPNQIHQGRAVAMSADGNTVIIGGSGDNTNTGAAWIFTRTGNTWSQQGAKLVGTGSVGQANMGAAVALSADGNTALVGGFNDNGGIGATWVFIRHNGIWTQQGVKLRGNDNNAAAGQGLYLALSADGNTAVVGGPNDFSGIGATWVFTRTGTTWAQQGPKLVGTGVVGKAYQGRVAVSADGNTIISGGYGDNSNKGAAWVFVRTGTSWAQLGSKLVGTGGGPADLQGNGVALSADGLTAVTGGPGLANTRGATWVFTRTGNTWTQHGNKLVGSGNITNGNQGKNVTISADGQTLFTAAPYENTNQGATWVFIPAAKQSQVIDFSPLTAVNYGTPYIQAVAVSTNPAISITFASSDTTIAVVKTDGKIYPKTGGSVTITASQAGDANYSDAVPVSQTLTINKLSLNVFADNKTVTQGFSSLALTASYEGFLKGDSISKLTTLPVLSTTATGTSAPGTYPITVSGGESPYYTLIYKPGTVTILPAQAAPQITSFSPKTGAVGTIVTITGSNLNFPSAFTIGGKPAVVVSNTGSKLVGMVMPGATNGPVSFSADSGSVTTSDNFVVKVTPYPSVQQGVNLTGTSVTGIKSLGYSVALSADGNTAIVGVTSEKKSAGVALIYTRNGDTWQQQGDNLIGTGHIGDYNYGLSVAISADGNTAVVGNSIDDNYKGAVWVFARHDNTWQQQGDKLVAPGPDRLSSGGTHSIAISADGNTIVVGAALDITGNNKGAVFVYKRTGETWQLDAKILAKNSDAAFMGGWVSVSADGNTIAAGGRYEYYGSGATWIFVRKGNYWLEQAKLIADGVTAFGQAVMLAPDGNDVFINCYGYLSNPAYGDVTVNRPLIKHFKKSGQSWVLQDDDYDKKYFTNITGIWDMVGSADARTILMAGGGLTSTYPVGIFAINGINKVGLTPADTRATAAAISADGSTAMVGFDDEAGKGVVRVYVPGQNQPQYIVFYQPAPLTYGTADTLLVANSTKPELPIIFASSDTTIAAIVNNKLHIKAAGRVNITASQADSLIEPITREVVINKAQLTITADDKVKVTGVANPVLTAGYSGFKNGDDATVVAIKPLLSTTATKNSAVGMYPITVTRAGAANYLFTYVNGTLNITTAALGANVNAKFTINPVALYTLTSSTPLVYNFTTSVSPDLESITIAPLTEGPGATAKVNGVPVANGKASQAINLPSQQTTVQVVVTGADGKTTRTYNIVVNKSGSSDLSMKSLALTNPRAGLVSISSAGNIFNKAASVPMATKTVNVYALANDPAATVKVNGNLLGGPESAPVTLNAGNTSTDINVLVTAHDGSARTYVITVYKFGSSDATLSTLNITAPTTAVITGSSSGTTYYRTASVSAATASITLKAIAKEAHATININSNQLTGETVQVGLNADNSPTNINVLVTAEDGTINTYILTVSKTGSSDATLKEFGLVKPVISVTSVSSSGTTYYKAAAVPAVTSFVTVRAVPTDANATVKVTDATKYLYDDYNKNDWVKSLNIDNSPTQVTVTVTAQDGSTRNYVIEITKAGTIDASMKSLEFTNLSSFVASVAEPKMMPYPNPFTDLVKLNIGNEGISKARVEISNLSAGGKVVYTNQYSNVSGVLQVNPGNLRNGVYVLKLTTDNLVRVFKIVKQ